MGVYFKVEKFNDIDRVVGNGVVCKQLGRFHVCLPLLSGVPVLERQEVARSLQVTMEVVLKATGLNQSGGDQFGQLGGCEGKAGTDQPAPRRVLAGLWELKTLGN